MVDIEAMKTIAEELYTPMVVGQHGDTGGIALRRILYAIETLYKHLPPETLTGKVVVFSRVTEDNAALIDGSYSTLRDLSLISQEYCENFAIQVQPDKTWLLWKNIQPDIRPIAQKAVVYTYYNRLEYFHAKNKSTIVTKLQTAYSSNFAIPTFDQLQDALEHYGSQMIRHSSCKLFKTVWHDENHILLKNAQEHVMRDSLTQALKCILREAEVRPEQSVNESKPVDIKVTWTFTNRLALIEIKWLGKSINQDTGKLTNDYTNSRATEGAKQLAHYLDLNKEQSPGHITRGYLVVIDARRKGVNSNTNIIDKTQGLHYKDIELIFNPEYHKIRDDFEQPIRMFAEPICH
jgi:hypothetical protein